MIFSAGMPPFSQEPISVTIVRTPFSMDGLVVHVMLRTWIRYGVRGGFWREKYDLELFCSDLRFVNLTSGGARAWMMLGLPVKCKLEYCSKYHSNW
ncbi:unnamed protein product [Camellia sinensis]